MSLNYPGGCKKHFITMKSNTDVSGAVIIITIMIILRLVMTSDGLCEERSLESHFLLHRMEERQRWRREVSS